MHGRKTNGRRPGKPHAIVSISQLWAKRGRRRGRITQKMLGKILEHNKELGVAIARLERASHKDLISRQTKLVVSLVRKGAPQQVFLHIANMSPEQFREYELALLMNKHHE